MADLIVSFFAAYPGLFGFERERKRDETRLSIFSVTIRPIDLSTIGRMRRPYFLSGMSEKCRLGPRSSFVRVNKNSRAEETYAARDLFLIRNNFNPSHTAGCCRIWTIGALPLAGRAVPYRDRVTVFFLLLLVLLLRNQVCARFRSIMNTCCTP